MARRRPVEAASGTCAAKIKSDAVCRFLKPRHDVPLAGSSLTELTTHQGPQNRFEPLPETVLAARVRTDIAEIVLIGDRSELAVLAVLASWPPPSEMPPDKTGK